MKIPGIPATDRAVFPPPSNGRACRDLGAGSTAVAPKLLTSVRL